MEEVDKGCPMTRMRVSGRVFLLVPGYPGIPRARAIKRLCVCVCVMHLWFVYCNKVFIVANNLYFDILLEIRHKESYALSIRNPVVGKHGLRPCHMLGSELC